MNKLIYGGEERNFTCRRIQNKSWRQSPLKDGGHAFPLLRWDAHGDLFPAVWKRGKRASLTMEKPDKYSLSQVIEDNVDSPKSF